MTPLSDRISEISDKKELLTPSLRSNHFPILRSTILLYSKKIFCHTINWVRIYRCQTNSEKEIKDHENFRKYHLEPKRIQFVYPKKNRNSDLFLIEGVKNGRSGIKLLSPLVIHKDNGEYTDEVHRLLNF